MIRMILNRTKSIAAAGICVAGMGTAIPSVSAYDHLEPEKSTQHGLPRMIRSNSFTKPTTATRHCGVAFVPCKPMFNEPIRRAPMPSLYAGEYHTAHRFEYLFVPTVSAPSCVYPIIGTSDAPSNTNNNPAQKIVTAVLTDIAVKGIEAAIGF
jgi:hypothetical protein